jgi:FixJ family two-component response regulator
MAGSTAKKPLISIVDDDDSVRGAVASLIRSVGFVARSFASAEEFLQSPELNETSCLISDVQMPGINGLELQSRLASQDRRTPIILITAFPEPHIRQAALKAGAICFLKKPFDGRALIHCVNRALNRFDT